MPLEYLLQQHWTTMMDGLIYSVSFVRFSIHTIETRYIFCDFFYWLISRLEKKLTSNKLQKIEKCRTFLLLSVFFFPHSVANRAKHFQFLQNSTPRRNIQNIEFHFFFSFWRLMPSLLDIFSPENFKLSGACNVCILTSRVLQKYRLTISVVLIPRGNFITFNLSCIFNHFCHFPCSAILIPMVKKRENRTKMNPIRCYIYKFFLSPPF